MSPIGYQQDNATDKETAPVIKIARNRLKDREMSTCMFGSGCTCCRNCNMGPCQIIDGVDSLIGVCGATSGNVIINAAQEVTAVTAHAQIKIFQIVVAGIVVVTVPFGQKKGSKAI